jgi:hypothetical protein
MYENDFQPSDEIQALAPRFEALGMSGIAARLRALSEPAAPGQVSSSFRSVPAEFGPDDLLSVDAAAHVLGLRSTSMVTTMADLGTLDAFWAGDRVVLSRESVERYGRSAPASTQRRIEEQLFSIFGGADDQ